MEKKKAVNKYKNYLVSQEKHNRSILSAWILKGLMNGINTLLYPVGSVY